MNMRFDQPMKRINPQTECLRCQAGAEDITAVKQSQNDYNSNECDVWLECDACDCRSPTYHFDEEDLTALEPLKRPQIKFGPNSFVVDSVPLRKNPLFDRQ